MRYINRILVFLFFVLLPYGYGFDFCGGTTDYSASLNTATETYVNNGTVTKQNNVNVVEENYYFTLEEPGYVEVNITSPSGKVYFNVQQASCDVPNDVTLTNYQSTSFYTTDLDFNIVVYPDDPTGSNNTDYPYTITVTYITVRDAYVAADVCYSDPSTCVEGVDCNTTIPLLNISDSNLSELSVVQKNAALSITNANISDCGPVCQEMNAAYLFGYKEDVLEGPEWEVGGLEQNATTDIYETLNTIITADTWPQGNIIYTTYKKFDPVVGAEVVYTGEMQYCIGGSPTDPSSISPPLRVDLIDTPDYIPGTRTDVDVDYYNNGTDKVVGTKVSGDTLVSLTAVHLDGNGVATTYTATEDELQVLVIPYLSDATCTDQQPLLLADGTEAFFSIPNGQSSQTKLLRIPAGASRESRFSVTYLDLNGLYLATGASCLKEIVSEDGEISTAGNLDGMSQCVNAALTQYLPAFGEDAYERCFFDNGNPCDSDNHGYSCGEDSTTCDGYNAIYDNRLGCMMCTLNIMPDCSSDNFAIRPEKFDINSTENSFPDLMRSGQDYDLSIYAYDYNSTTSTVGYIQNKANLDVAQVRKYWGDGGEANASIFGIGSWGATDFNITNGVTTVTGVVSPVPYKYSDVGDIAIRVIDAEWASVDIDNPNDLTPTDCTADGAYVCGEKNATFIPHHFDVLVSDLHNNAPNDKFTYLSNDVNETIMGARLDVTITAKNAVGATTKNFTRPAYGHVLYENNVTVTVKAPAHPTQGNANPHDINVSTLIGFDSGVKTIPWNEDNESLMLTFNYPRSADKAVNPFIVDGNQTFVDANSTYPDVGIAVAPEGTADINGTDDAPLNDKVTFVYGRTHMARTRAMCDNSPGYCTGQVTFFYEFYGDEDANRTIINSVLTNPKRSIDSVNWYRNTEHNTSADGNVTGIASSIPGMGTPLLTHFPTNTSANVVYNKTQGFPYKDTLDISTQSWLIYDKFNAAAGSVSGELEYYGPGQWSGATGAETSVKDNSGTKNRNTNRRIRW